MKYSNLALGALTAITFSFTLLPAQTFEWARTYSDLSSDMGNSIAVDPSGNIYTVGYFESTADFDPGAGSSYLTSKGGRDVFIQKMDATGNLIWAKSIGGTSGDDGLSIAVDPSGNLLITGSFFFTVDFDPGAGSSNLTATGSSGGSDIFVLKIDANGNFIWARAFGGTGFDNGNAIATDASGNVYTTGGFRGSADFDPGAGTFLLTGVGTGSDIFVQKLDASGNFLWARSFGGTSFDSGTALAVDASGNVCTTGNFQGTVDLDPGAGTSTHTASGTFGNLFVQKMDASGNFLWAKSIGGSGDDGSSSISLDGSGNVYISGAFQETVDFDTGAGTSNLTSAGNYDVFVQKMDASGNFLWARAFGGAINDRGSSLAADASGNVYITGIFQETVDFDPGTGTSNLTSNGRHDIFVQKLDANGTFLWVKSFGGEQTETVNDLALDASGNVYTTGSFGALVDFDPGAGISPQKAVGSLHIFVQKLNTGGDFLWVKSFGGAIYDAGGRIAVDASRNIYSTGQFESTLDLNPSATVFTLQAKGVGADIFVQKMDAGGNFLWAKSFGGPEDDRSVAIAVDASGNVYTAGMFQGAADFDPGTGTSTLTAIGGTDIFIQKLDASGNFVWAKSFGGSSSDTVSSLVIDASGNIYTAGDFQGTVDFDPGAGSSNLTANGNRDAFVQKIAANGNFLWARSFGGSANEGVNSLATDGAGQVFTAGSFGATVDFDPGAGTSNLTATGTTNTYIQKMDANGSFLWVSSFGASAVDEIHAIATDAAGKVFSTGSYRGTADFDPGAGISNLVAGGNADVFVHAMDASGNFLWAKSLGGTSEDSGHALTVDATGNVYTAGSFEGTADVDPGAGTLNLVAKGKKDVFVQKLDADGDFLWAKSFGGSGDDRANAIAVDALGNVYTAGQFQDTVDFDPDSGTSDLTSQGIQDMFVQKMSQSATSIDELTEGFDFSIFPNPANDFIRVTHVPLNARVDMTDISGKVVYSSMVYDTETVIQTNTFVSGIYVVSVHSKGSVSNRKLVLRK
ncbi:MAG: T9SS C-terminal target domain-containing protein [Bacteroidetes bacterium]|nr:MAG: T9SS C-terminal target domain-containing protein [Bacteroidota bacterium]